MANPLAQDLDSVLSQVGAAWDALRGARLFITGGTGFFGCWLLETLLWANERLGLEASAVVLTRDPARFRRRVPHLAIGRGVTLHPGDVRSFDGPDGSFTHVLHAAADPTPPRTRAERLRVFETIVTGTARVLGFAQAVGAERLLLTSSGAIYGRQPADVLRVPEDDRGGPRPNQDADAYGEAKRAAEMLCALHADDRLCPTIARCFAFVGPYLPLDANFAIGNFIGDVLGGRPIRITGDGTPYRSYLYGADLAAWLWTILLRGAAARPYNVGSPDGLTIADVAARVARVVGRGAAVEIAQQPVPGSTPQRYVPCTARAELELGLRVTVPLDAAIARTFAWHEQRASA